MSFTKRNKKAKSLGPRLGIKLVIPFLCECFLMLDTLKSIFMEHIANIRVN